MTGCRIGRIILKNGCEVLRFPEEAMNVQRFDIGWGEIVFRLFNNESISRETMVYMLRAVENKILYED